MKNALEQDVLQHNSKKPKQKNAFAKSKKIKEMA